MALFSRNTLPFALPALLGMVAAPTAVAALPLTMATGMRASCGDMDLPASMDQAVRTDLAQASCGVTGGGLKFVGANPSDRAMSLHDDDGVCLGGLCFDESSSSSQGGSGNGARGVASSSGHGGGGGGGGGAPGGGRSHAGGRGRAAAFVPSYGGTPPPFATAGLPGNGRGARSPFAGEANDAGDPPGIDDVPGDRFAVSEPKTLVLLGAGLIVAAVGSRRRGGRRT
jgi:hypothetical protein